MRLIAVVLFAVGGFISACSSAGEPAEAPGSPKVEAQAVPAAPSLSASVIATELEAPTIPTVSMATQESEELSDPTNLVVPQPPTATPTSLPTEPVLPTLPPLYNSARHYVCCLVVDQASRFGIWLRLRCDRL